MAFHSQAAFLASFATSVFMKVTPHILLDNGSVSIGKEREKACVGRGRCGCWGEGSYNTANEHISVFHFLQMFSGFHMSAACRSLCSSSLALLTLGLPLMEDMCIPCIFHLCLCLRSNLELLWRRQKEK